MNTTEALEQLKAQIEADLKVASDIESNQYHLQGLEAVEALLDYLA